MAKDLFHDRVRHALEKEGWTISHDPYHLRYGSADVFIDLAAEIERFNVNLMVYDPSREEITVWIS